MKKNFYRFDIQIAHNPHTMANRACNSEKSGF